MKHMNNELNRRSFINVASGAALAIGGIASASTPGAENASVEQTKIVGIACSPRKGMTTSKAVQAALDAAKAVDEQIETELIDLGGLSIAGWSPKPPQDDFVPILPRLADPAVGALIVGSPCYFRGISSLCKAFIERCMPLREPKMLLDGKLLGAIAVGGARNGGQEMVAQQIQAAMLCFGMTIVSGGPAAPLGATLLSAQDSLASDQAGLETAKAVGRRVALALLAKRK